MSSEKPSKHSVMNPSLHNFRESLLQRLLDLLWRQWSALGVAGHARSDDPWMIDPEALLLFSTHIARHDSRLFDEILDWLHTNGSWLNLQRLGTLHKQEHLGDSAVLAAIADLLSRESSHHKWKLLIRRVEKPGSPAAGLVQRLFPTVPVLKEPDPVFLKHGLERGGIDLRGMSQSPRPDQPATFLFKLRALFGMQERDKALQSIRELITAKLDEIMQVDSEISGVKNETKKEGEISEELTKKLGKAKFELEVLQQRKDDIEADKNRLQEKFTMLKFSLSQTEEEGGRMDKERINVEDKM